MGACPSECEFEASPFVVWVEWCGHGSGGFGPDVEDIRALVAQFLGVFGGEWGVVVACGGKRVRRDIPYRHDSGWDEGERLWVEMECAHVRRALSLLEFEAERVFWASLDQVEPVERGVGEKKNAAFADGLGEGG